MPKISLIYICTTCGEKILKSEFIDSESGKKLCPKCSSNLTMDNLYPNSTADDLLLTAEDLYKDCKKIDKENKTVMLEYLQYRNLLLDKTELDSNINVFESVKEKYRHNDKDYYLTVSREFEDRMEKKYGTKIGIRIAFQIEAFDQNRYRKLFIISLASLIEVLFYDCFNALIKLKLGEKGGAIFLKQSENFGIKQSLAFIDSFLINDIDTEMNLISHNFSNKWEELRKLRNGVIHSNDRFVSKIKINHFYKLLDESVRVFASIKSKIYSHEI